MRDLEDSARPVLTSLMLSQSALLTPLDQAKVATWAVLKTIVIVSLNEPRRQAIGSEERALFMGARLPQPGWGVWLGHYAGGLYSPMRYRTIAVSQALPSVKEAPPVANTQATTIVIGSLYLHVFSSAWIGSEVPYEEALMRAQIPVLRLWPPVNRDIASPPVIPVSDFQADVAHYLLGANARP